MQYKYTLDYPKFRNLVNKHIVEFTEGAVDIDLLPDFDLWNYFSENENLTEKDWNSMANDAARDWLESEGLDLDD